MGDFVRLFEKQERLTTVNVIYFLPDYQNLLQNFIWQTLDIPPKYPRIHRFLDFWEAEIDAQIKEVVMSTNHKLQPNLFRSLDDEFRHK